MFRPTRVLTGLVVVLVALLSLTACSNSSETSTEGKQVVDTVTLTVTGGEVEPSGERVAVARDKPFTFVIDSDEAGELHIHSKPEQAISYESGRSEHQVTFKTPGIFPVESHDLDKVIVELEVR